MEELTVHGVVFDMDGVLVDTRSLIETAWRTAAGRFGVTITDEDMSRSVHGQQSSHTLRALFPSHSAAQREEIWRYAAEIEERSPCDAVPGVVPLIRQLRAADVVLGLVTSNWPARVGHVVRLLGLDGVFAAIVSRTDTTRGKPHPEPYLLAAQRLSLAPETLLVFEDSDSGIQAATGARARCVAVGPGGQHRPAVVDTIADFTGLAVTRADNGHSLLSGLRCRVVLRPDDGGPRT
jgi:sugar-phosphatase